MVDITLVAHMLAEWREADERGIAQLQERVGELTRLSVSICEQLMTIDTARRRGCEDTAHLQDCVQELLTLNRSALAVEHQRRLPDDGPVDRWSSQEDADDQAAELPRKRPGDQPIDRQPSQEASNNPAARLRCERTGDQLVLGRSLQDERRCVELVSHPGNEAGSQQEKDNGGGGVVLRPCILCGGGGGSSDGWHEESARILEAHAARLIDVVASEVRTLVQDVTCAVRGAEDARRLEAPDNRQSIELSLERLVLLMEECQGAGVGCSEKALDGHAARLSEILRTEFQRLIEMVTRVVEVAERAQREAEAESPHNKWQSIELSLLRLVDRVEGTCRLSQDAAECWYARADRAVVRLEKHGGAAIDYSALQKDMTAGIATVVAPELQQLGHAVMRATESAAVAWRSDTKEWLRSLDASWRERDEKFEVMCRFSRDQPSRWRAEQHQSRIDGVVVDSKAFSPRPVSPQVGVPKSLDLEVFQADICRVAKEAIQEVSHLLRRDIANTATESVTGLSQHIQECVCESSAVGVELIEKHLDERLASARLANRERVPRKQLDPDVLRGEINHMITEANQQVTLSLRADIAAATQEAAREIEECIRESSSAGIEILQGMRSQKCSGDDDMAAEAVRWRDEASRWRDEAQSTSMELEMMRTDAACSVDLVQKSVAKAEQARTEVQDLTQKLKKAHEANEVKEALQNEVESLKDDLKMAEEARKNSECLRSERQELQERLQTLQGALAHAEHARSDADKASTGEIHALQAEAKEAKEESGRLKIQVLGLQAELEALAKKEGETLIPEDALAEEELEEALPAFGSGNALFANSYGKGAATLADSMARATSLPLRTAAGHLIEEGTEPTARAASVPRRTWSTVQEEHHADGSVTWC